MTANHEHLREVAEKASHGPWKVDGDVFDNDGFPESVIRQGEASYVIGCVIDIHRDHPEFREANAEFIAIFNPAIAIALIDELDALRKENEGLRVDAERWRAARDNTGDGIRIITWDHKAEEELQVMFPSPILCDEYADAARAAIGDSHE